MLDFIDEPLILYFCSASLILVTLIIVKHMITTWNIHRETGRKILHFVAIMTCAFVVFHNNDRVTLAYIFFAFGTVLFYIAYKNILLPSDRTSYGIAFFPLSFGLLLLSPLSTESIIFGIATLGVSDAFGGYIGEHYARKKHIFLFEKKSWLGFTTFYISTFIIGYLFIGLTPPLVILALVPALSELFSYRGSDNFTVPLVSSIWFSVLIGKPILFSTHIIFIFILVSCVAVFHKKWLTMSGTAAAIMMGTIIIYSEDPQFLIPISIFFIVGSLTARLHPRSKDASGRTAIQVFANGMVAVVLLIFYSFTKNDILMIAYFASIAISFADTLSSDFGIYFNHKTYDITTCQLINTGLSGGISISGTLAGILGSFGFAWMVKMVFNLDFQEMTTIGIVGAVGMIIDSLLGSLWQAKYAINNQVTEDANESNILIKGLPWLNNDGVNLLANFSTMSFFLWTFL